MLRSSLLPLFALVGGLVGLVSADSISQFPPCTSKCALAAAQTDNCQPDDVQCICNDSDFLGKIQVCAVNSNCNFGDISTSAFRLQAMCAAAQSSTAAASTTASRPAASSGSVSTSAKPSQSASSKAAATNTPANTPATNTAASSAASTPTILANTLNSVPTSSSGADVIQFVSSIVTADTSTPTDGGSGGDPVAPLSAGFSVKESRLSLGVLALITTTVLFASW